MGVRRELTGARRPGRIRCSSWLARCWADGPVRTLLRLEYQGDHSASYDEEICGRESITAAVGSRSSR